MDKIKAAAGVSPSRSQPSRGLAEYLREESVLQKSDRVCVNLTREDVKAILSFLSEKQTIKEPRVVPCDLCGCGTPGVYCAPSAERRTVVCVSDEQLLETYQDGRYAAECPVSGTGDDPHISGLRAIAEASGFTPSHVGDTKPVAWANWKVGTDSYIPKRTREEAEASVQRSQISATQEGPYEVVPLYCTPSATDSRNDPTEGAAADFLRRSSTRNKA